MRGVNSFADVVGFDRRGWLAKKIELGEGTEISAKRSLLLRQFRFRALKMARHSRSRSTTFAASLERISIQWENSTDF